MHCRQYRFFFACGVMVSIEPSQGLDPGSIPGRRTFFADGIARI